ncbi:tRNA processing endoribonuclease [Hirsutella rhossiliensis]|uniref:tRNA processing endoribonuclease n=1 Tax=Hirsutella rhossiliensis TaxID=111463 RepID=A0A9P8SIS7_9HYPO|nr:tRNA processing endoribonuclease [Hirsutella rhossiliensis]KAH0962316.1 tRNA processing endoribonuclease [Hirsutella rhossiliensis]
MSDTMQSRTAGTHKLPTAKWGAACAACASAKAKCIRSDSAPGAKCDRCQRLLKDCADQVHRVRKKRQSKPSRTAQIEERLNGLVNLLQANGASLDLPPSRRETPSASSTVSHQPEHASWAIPDGDAPPPPDSDDVLLDLYRNEMQPVYPFVIVPPTCSAASLHSSRPFLMSAIRMVASFRSLRSMRAQMCHLMSHISDHVLMRSERSLDLVQGIIVMLGWYQYHCFMHAQMNNLIMLAMSLVAELGLNRPPVLREQASLMEPRPVEPPGRVNEERRALAAVWFVSSTTATTFGKIESMRYSPYLRECVKDLEESREYETDTILVFLVKVQHLTERIHEQNLRSETSEDIRGIPTAPKSAYIFALQNELDRIHDNLPREIKMDSTMQIYINTATLRLYEPPLADMKLINQLSESLTVGTVGAGTALDKIYRTSSALRAWFDNWLSVPVSTYYRQPAAIASQLVYGLTMLGRWAKLATPRTMYQGGTPMPGCGGAGAGTSNMPVYAADHQPPPDGSAVPETEPGLPAAVGALQSQLQTQPGLTVNIPEILSAICSRLEQVNSSFQTTSAESGKMDNNIWSFSALKIRITRVKLERWAELVSAGAEASNRENSSSDVDGSNAAGLGPWRGPDPRQVGDGGMGGLANVQAGSLAQDQTQIQNFLGSTPWTSDLLDGIDPTVWFDGYLDWGAVIMNSMGTVEQ